MISRLSFLQCTLLVCTWPEIKYTNLIYTRTLLAKKATPFSNVTILLLWSLILKPNVVWIVKWIRKKVQKFSLPNTLKQYLKCKKYVWYLGNIWGQELLRIIRINLYCTWPRWLKNIPSRRWVWEWQVRAGRCSRRQAPERKFHQTTS